MTYRKQLAAALSLCAVLGAAGAKAQATPAYVTNVFGVVGVPSHVTVYLNGAALSPASSPVTWSGLPTGVSETADSTGYNFSATQPIGATSITATAGQSTGSLIITFTAPPLQFTSP